MIYCGTTGKTVFPSLEIGYLVVPLSLLESFSKAKEIMGAAPAPSIRRRLHTFLEGHFERHLQRMNAIYFQRLQALSQAVDSELDGYIDLEPASGGLHAVGWLARGLDETSVATRPLARALSCRFCRVTGEPHSCGLAFYSDSPRLPKRPFAKPFSASAKLRAPEPTIARFYRLHCLRQALKSQAFYAACSALDPRRRSGAVGFH